MRMVVVERGRPLPKAEQKAALKEMSDRFRARQGQRKLERTQERYAEAPEKGSMAVAMLAVEDRLVRAFWTIALQPGRRVAPATLSRCGLDYLPGENDREACYKDAAGGDWSSVAPRPPTPRSKDIDAAEEAQRWLLYVDEADRKLLVAGATSKRGDMGRNINWERLKEGMPELRGLKTRTLRGRYREALRVIVLELTFAAMLGS